jgi:hypothetical protein
MLGPNFYAVTNCVALDPSEWGLPRVAKVLYILEFGTRDLANPDSDPIGMYSYAGMRRYFWRDKFWAEVELHTSHVLKQATHRLNECVVDGERDRLTGLIAVLKSYAFSYPPNGHIDTIDNPATAAKVFCRVVYEINQKHEAATPAQ